MKHGSRAKNVLNTMENPFFFLLLFFTIEGKRDINKWKGCSVSGIVNVKL